MKHPPASGDACVAVTFNSQDEVDTANEVLRLAANPKCGAERTALRVLTSEGVDNRFDFLPLEHRE